MRIDATQRRLEVCHVTIEGGRDAHSEHRTFSSAAHRENWKDCAISSSWIRQSSNKITPFERCTPSYPSG